MMDLEELLRRALDSEALQAPTSPPLSPRFRRRIAIHRSIVVGGFGSVALAGFLVLNSFIIAPSEGLRTPANDSGGGSPSDAVEPAAIGECRAIPEERGEHSWLGNADAQAGVAAIGAALRAEFGVDAGSPDGLKLGLIGLAADDATQTEYVVIDPTVYREGAELEESLRQASDAAIADDARQFPVKVIASCHSAQDLLAARDVLEGLEDSRFMGKLSFGWGLDPYTSTWSVNIDPGSSLSDELARYLQGEIGDVLTIEWVEGGLQVGPLG